MSVGAQLVALSGPVQGTVVSLPDSELSIGREEGNVLRLEDRAVSRRHCVIVRAGGDFHIRDLQSANRTQVNGLPVEEKRLEHGDEIRIGRSVFLFLSEAEGASSSVAEVAFADDDSRATAVLTRESFRYAHPEKMVDEAVPAGNTARALKCMLRLADAISTARSVAEVSEPLFGLLAQLFPRAHGVLLVGRRWEELETAHFRNWREHSRNPFAISQPLIRRLWQERAVVSSQDAVPAAVAVPLVWSEEVLGAIYMETADVETRFGDEDLQLLAGIAAVTAAPLVNARRFERLESENRRVEAELHGEYEMAGASTPMREVYQFIRKAAPTDSTVLIRGETGTGKELVARAIHRNSPRAHKPFVAINCAAVTETLLESEFFGHEKGAYTGAVAMKKGKLELADGGTVFLDEIGELAGPLQAKLLRVLQEREFERVGGTHAIRVDIRVIAATNRNLEESVQSRSFRQDLYYRLNVVALTLPALRERREDIPVLVQHLLQKRCAAARRKITGISEEAEACLMAYDWPGNVRELENALERAIVLGMTEEILPEDLPECILESQPARVSTSGLKFYESIREWKRQVVINAMHDAGRNHAAAARMLGLHPKNFSRLLKSLNIS